MILENKTIVEVEGLKEMHDDKINELERLCIRCFLITYLNLCVQIWSS